MTMWLYFDTHHSGFLKKYIIITTCIALFIIANVITDFSATWYQNSSFYLSESLLFSSYWLLFLPLMIFVLKMIKETEKLTLRLLLISVVIVLHLFFYPALVWTVSKIAYAHTFDYWQTFNFGLSAYFIKTVIIYGFFLMTFTITNQKNHSLLVSKKVEKETNKQNVINSILVTDNNKKLWLEVNDIFYFSSNTPYINVYHLNKKYLHSTTLKLLEAQLNNEQFVRIHKSYIVNIHKVSFIQSRQNGDYDVTLFDNSVLRISRSYAKNFKSIFSKQHQLSIK